MHASGVPSVSLIVRSVGRPELAEALASAGAQTHADVTVVVVDATGGAHPPVPERCGPHPIAFVPGTAPRKRAVAANAGLDAARGDYIGFLDDDDLLLPHHVAGLVAALEGDRGVDVAYALVRELRAGGDAQLVGHAKLTRLVLLEQCFFPPCAALFRRRLARDCRFDESLEAAEDWDFWLQASRSTAFRFVAQESAIYRADRGRSAMTGGAADTAGHWRDVVWAKWAADREKLGRSMDEWFDRALVLARHGDYAGAADAAGEVLALYPFHAGALCLRGTHHAIAGRLDAARADFADAVAADPDEPSALFNLAQADERLGRVDEAAALYRRVLAVDAAHPNARTRLAALARRAS